MIAGTGIDLVEIRRVARLVEKHAGLSRLYGAEELVLLRRKNSAASYAANFCAKEAFAKALGTGVCGFLLRDVQLLRDGRGRPYYRLSGRAREMAAEEGLTFHVSVTHTDQYAAAFAVAERRDSP